MRRLKVFVIMLIFLLAMVALGAVSPLEESEATRIIEEVKKIIPEEPDIPTIFINNLRIALLMLIPIIGLIIGSIAIYNTGLVFSATSITTGVPSSLLLVATILLPFFWLEFIAYAASMTQNIYLTASLIRRRIRGELKRLIYAIALLAVLLFGGAVVEVLILNLFK